MDFFAPSTWSDSQRAAGVAIITGLASFLASSLQESGKGLQISNMAYNSSMGQYLPTYNAIVVSKSNNHTH